MDWQRESWTWLLVTLVTVLIWFWAAAETREQRTVTARVHLAVPDPENWLIEPQDIVAAVALEGSKPALQGADNMLRRPINISVSGVEGHQLINVLDRLRRHNELRELGVAITSTEPASVDIEMQQIVRVQADVKLELPGATTEGDITITPPEVSVSMPSQMRARLPQPFQVLAIVDRTELDRLAPGARQNLDVKLQLPEPIASAPNVKMSRTRVSASFAIRSRIRETKLDSVPVQISDRPEDRSQYQVEIDPAVLRDVTVSADADLIKRIESGEAPVVAVLHLESRDLQTGGPQTASKRISYFLALVPGPNGSTKGQQVDAKVGGAAEMPVIGLKVAKR